MLHHYVGLAPTEIAEVIGIPPGTARSRLHYAHRAMRAALEADSRLGAVAGFERDDPTPRDRARPGPVVRGRASTQLSDRALTDALSEIDHTRQLGAHVVPWRYSEMPTPVRLLLVAALLMAVSAGAALLISAGGLIPTPEPTPTTDEPVTSGPGMVIGTDPSGGWSANRPAAFGNPTGDWQLNFGPRDTFLVARSADGQDVLLGSMTGNGANGTTLGPTDRCPEAGDYEHHVSDNTRIFSISVVADTCADRATLLAGDWTRLHVDAWLQTGDRYRLVGDGVTLDLTVPASFVNPDGQTTDYDGSPKSGEPRPLQER